jgi:hypothetical protein
MACALAWALSWALAACQTAGSPGGRAIALEGIEGAPAAVQTALAGELASAASARKVEMVGAGNPARYRVKGYLTTERTPDGGTALSFVWDVFGADRRLARRVAGSTPVAAAAPKGSGKSARMTGKTGKNPWDGLDKEALARLAARSMDEIATFLAAGPGTAAPEPMDDVASES